MAEVLQALIDAALRIDQVEEYDSLEWPAGPINQLGEDGRFRLAGDGSDHGHVVGVGNQGVTTGSAALTTRTQRHLQCASCAPALSLGS